jgi:putative DNA primase/helicase
VSAQTSAVSGRLEGYADFADPAAAAEAIIHRQFHIVGGQVLHYWQGEFWIWVQDHYERMPLADVRARLWEIGPAVSAQAVKKRHVDDVLDALKAKVNLSQRLAPEPPVWLRRRVADPLPRDLIPLRNGLLRVDDGELLPLSPRFFCHYALPFEFKPDPPAPLAWLDFLRSIWPDDEQCVDSLQELMGLLLTQDTRHQKGAMLVGPKRAGKGAVLRTIVRLVGQQNCASPTLASLGMPFGLQALIGKSVALISDARLGRQADVAAVAENLLRITGEDLISVPRKFQEDYTARLGVRIVIACNEVPVFRDAASALPSRFIVLPFTRSFYGKEDLQLEERIAAELPGVFAWALAGLRRLREHGRLTQPRAGKRSMQLMEDLASPIGTFLRERCVVEPGGEVPIQKLYEQWRAWCKEHGRDSPGTEQTFGRDIAAAAPGLGSTRKRIDGDRVRYYVGLRLREPGDEDFDEDAD